MCDGHHEQDTVGQYKACMLTYIYIVDIQGKAHCVVPWCIHVYHDNAQFKVTWDYVHASDYFEYALMIELVKWFTSILHGSFIATHLTYFIDSHVLRFLMYFFFFYLFEMFIWKCSMKNIEAVHNLSVSTLLTIYIEYMKKKGKKEKKTREKDWK